MYDEIAIQRLMAKIRQAAQGPIVLSVADHFAGYFDELGITIGIRPEATKDQIAELRREIYVVMNQAEVPFKWIVMFEQRKKSVGVLVPNDPSSGELYE